MIDNLSEKAIMYYHLHNAIIIKKNFTVYVITQADRLWEARVAILHVILDFVIVCNALRKQRKAKIVMWEVFYTVPFCKRTKVGFCYLGGSVEHS